MKYVWLVALLLLLGATWSMGSSDDVARLSDLADRQAEFARLITNSIKASRPNVTDVEFEQLYVESIKADETLKAHFRYVIHELTAGSSETTDQTIEGTSMLTSADGGLSWQVSKIATSDSGITFNEGTIITPDHRRGGSEQPATPDAEQVPEPDLKQ